MLSSNFSSLRLRLRVMASQFTRSASQPLAHHSTRARLADDAGGLKALRRGTEGGLRAHRTPAQLLLQPHCAAHPHSRPPEYSPRLASSSSNLRAGKSGKYLHPIVLRAVVDDLASHATLLGVFARLW